MSTKALRLAYLSALLSGHNVDATRAALSVVRALNVRPVLALPYHP